MKAIDLGCGLFPYPDALHIDAVKYNGSVDLQLNVVTDKLPVGPYDYVHCSHLLEYLTYREAALVLKKIYRLTANRGFVRLVVPDLEFYIHAAHNPRVSKYYDTIQEITCGKQLHEFDIVKSVYTIGILDALLKEATPEFHVVEKTNAMYNAYNHNGDIQYILKKTRI